MPLYGSPILSMMWLARSGGILANIVLDPIAKRCSILNPCSRRRPHVQLEFSAIHASGKNPARPTEKRERKNASRQKNRR